MFDFIPKLIMIVAYDQYPDTLLSQIYSNIADITKQIVVLMPECFDASYKNFGFGPRTNDSKAKTDINTKTFFWYNGTNANSQYNSSGWKFYWTAIG